MVRFFKKLYFHSIFFLNGFAAINSAHFDIFMYYFRRRERFAICELEFSATQSGSAVGGSAAFCSMFLPAPSVMRE